MQSDLSGLLGGNYWRSTMIRIILCRVLICSWMIPTIYLGVLPMMYLISGNFKGQLIETNAFIWALWFGRC